MNNYLSEEDIMYSQKLLLISFCLLTFFITSCCTSVIPKESAEKYANFIKKNYAMNFIKVRKLMTKDLMKKKTLSNFVYCLSQAIEVQNDIVNNLSGYSSDFDEITKLNEEILNIETDVCDLLLDMEKLVKEKNFKDSKYEFTTYAGKLTYLGHKQKVWFEKFVIMLKKYSLYTEQSRRGERRH